MLHLPHHQSSERFLSNPYPAVGETVQVSLELPRHWPGTEVQLRTVVDGEAVWVANSGQAATPRFDLLCDQPVQRYRFHLRGPAGAFWLNGAGVLDHDPDDHADFKLLPGRRAPAWVTERVWYQIFPDRFATTGAYKFDEDWVDWSAWEDPIKAHPDSMRQAYGGDLDGIAEHLAHLKDLGIGGVYLTPIFPARSNHRYDATTFDRIDPIVGGDDALIRLREACHQAGMKLTTDLTLNHTGDAHEWFVAAQAAADSAEASFYHFTNHPEDYESWLGVRSLPKLDHRSDEMANRFYRGSSSIVAKYLNEPYELDGWRIDVANMSGRLGQLDVNQRVAQDTRATMDAVDSERGEHEGASAKWLVGEHFFDAARDTPGDGWHGVMNYAGVSRPVASWLAKSDMLEKMMPGPGQDVRNGIQMAAAMDTVRAVMPWSITLGSMSLLSSHDTARWRSMCTSDGAALVGFGLLITLPGTPCFFYGDEIGLTGGDNEASRRTMPWDSPSTWDTRFLEWYSTLIAARNEHPALQTGGFRWIHVDEDQVVFLRESAAQRILVRASRASGDPVALEADLLGAQTLTSVVGGNDLASISGTLELPAGGPEFSAWVLNS